MRFGLQFWCVWAACCALAATRRSNINKLNVVAFIPTLESQQHGQTGHDSIQHLLPLFSSISTQSEKNVATKEPLVIIKSMNQVNQCLRRNETSPILVEGFITAKRAFGSSFGFLDVNTNDDGLVVVVQIMVKRQEFHGDLNGLLDGLSLGMSIRVEGIVTETRNPGEGVVLVHSCDIVGLPPNPQHVRKLLRLISQDKLSTNQVAPAANMTSAELSERIHVASKGTGDFTMLAKELLSWSSNKQERVSTAVLVDDSSRRSSLPPIPPELSNPPTIMTLQTDADSDDAISVPSVSNLYSQVDHLLGKYVTINVWVQNRRKFQENVTVLKVCDSFVAVSATTDDQVEHVSSNSTAIAFNSRCQCVLHPNVLKDGVAATVYGNLLCAGSRVRIEGYVNVQQHESSSPTLWITNAQLLRCSWRPLVIRYLIELVVRDEFDRAEAANALGIDLVQASELSQLDLTERQWKANELSRNLQDSQTRMASVSDEMLGVLASFEELRRAFPKQQDVCGSVATSSKTKVSHIASYHQKDGALLATNRPGTWWQRKKRPQLEFMGRQIKDVVRSHPDYGKRTLRILDVGGGKGLLATYLAQLLENDIHVQVIDIAGGAIKNGMMRSKRLALNTPVEFTAGDASQFEHESDIVVALHACGSLSDVALGHAVNSDAGFVICPCCFRSNGHLRVPVKRQDGNVREFQLPHEWLGIDTHTLDTVKRIAEIQGEANLASEGMHTLCAMRANAANRHSRARGVELGVSIKTFPSSYSTRNVCLVGKVKRRLT